VIRRGLGSRVLRAFSLLARRGFPGRKTESRVAFADSKEVDRARAIEWILDEAARFGLACDPELAGRVLDLASRPCAKPVVIAKPPERRPRLQRTALPGDLAAIACYFNPAGYKKIRRNYLQFLHHMKWWNVDLFVAEIAFASEDFVDPCAFIRLRGGERNIMWQKERLLNLIVESLPPRYDKIAWIDADILFLNPGWASEVKEKLEFDPVVQLWNRWHCVNSAGAIGGDLQGIGDDAWRYLKTKSSPGGAWAARRAVFPLYDRHILGSGDAMAVLAWCGRLERLAIKHSSEAMREDFVNWAKTAYDKVRGQISCASGDAVHLNHGDRSRRMYVDRWKPAVKWGFDPQKHIEIEQSGIFAWTAEAPHQLKSWVSEYFRVRDEDG